ncbi:MAG: DNA-3-methyladenine glycosylase I [Planctomycetaceae bacterium]
MTGSHDRTRCAWISNALMRTYHDEEWGVPVHDDRLHFEYIVLDGAQAGLSWQTVLNKRENYRKAFAGFDPAKVARFNTRKIESLLKDPGIIRNRQKVVSAVKNAKAFLKVQDECGSFDEYVWRFTDGGTIVNKWKTLEELPATSPESDAMSKDLKGRGFSFVGSTICYAYMQAAGMVNDHVTACFRYNEVIQGR